SRLCVRQRMRWYGYGRSGPIPFSARSSSSDTVVSPSTLTAIASDRNPSFATLSVHVPEPSPSTVNEPSTSVTALRRFWPLDTSMDAPASGTAPASVRPAMVPVSRKSPVIAAADAPSLGAMGTAVLVQPTIESAAASAAINFFISLLLSFQAWPSPHTMFHCIGHLLSRHAPEGDETAQKDRRCAIAVGFRPEKRVT